MLFYIPHMTAYSLAAALLMCSWLLSGRTTDRSSSTHPQLMPATASLCRAIGLFNLRARSSYERRPVTCPGNWSTVLIPVNYVSFLGPKEIAEYDVFFLAAAGTFVSGCWHRAPPPIHTECSPFLGSLTCSPWLIGILPVSLGLPLTPELTAPENQLILCRQTQFIILLAPSFLKYAVSKIQG